MVYCEIWPEGDGSAQFTVYRATRLDAATATPDKVRLMKRIVQKPAVDTCCGIIFITG
jgi:hypothetical protein